MQAGLSVLGANPKLKMSLEGGVDESLNPPFVRISFATYEEKSSQLNLCEMHAWNLSLCLHEPRLSLLFCCAILPSNENTHAFDDISSANYEKCNWDVQVCKFDAVCMYELSKAKSKSLAFYYDLKSEPCRSLRIGPSLVCN